MATNFPTSLDSYSTKVNGNTVQAADVNNPQDAIVALETRVGITGSADATSLTKRIAVLEAAGGGAAYPQSYLRANDRLCNIDLHRALQDNAVSLSDQQFIVSYFTAAASLTTTTIRFYVGTAASSSTSASGFGLYSVDSSDNITLLTSVTGTTIFASTGIRTGTWAASQALTKGTRYAVVALHCAGSGTPILAGTQFNTGVAALHNVLPRTTAVRLTRTSLDASATAANLATAQQNMFYVEIY